MKIYEVLNFHRELLKRLYDSGVRLEDACYVDMYADYSRMHADGEKVSYIVAVLSEKYAIRERKVYSLIKRFQCDCVSSAV